MLLGDGGFRLRMATSSPCPLSTLAVPAPILVSSRLALHLLAFYVLSAARQAATGAIGLRPTPGGFGTPPFRDARGRRREIRVDGTDLVIESDGQREREPITTLGAAAERVGITPDADRGAEFDVPPMGRLDQPLMVDPGASVLLARWYAFGIESLAALGTLAGPDADATEAQLWPEHFDVGLDLGSADTGRRGSYGASPGDDHHHEPYLYVASWSEVDRTDPFWNDRHFSGASVGWAELVADPDPAGRARSFLTEGFRRVTAT